ncbi:MAG: MFS transporter [Celeribacter sp.]|jgi:DHA1 family bicyclomycin/chloramphenicol resistance-like MFS transporter
MTALAIDGVLPAMPMIEADFSLLPPYSGGQIITIFVLGMAVGELLIGPFMDATGRRPAVIGGLVLFGIGTIIAGTADSYGAVVAGRFLQGVGIAGPKIGTRAMIRDRYAGTDMAQVMSVIFTLLILIPMIAPAIGAVIVATSGWRGVFWAYLAMAVGLGAWLWTRHPETLPVDKRIPLQFRRLATNCRIVLTRSDVAPVIVATGLIFGAQLTYFSVAADLFGAVYDLSASMPAFFALLATGTGAALLLNVRFVGRTGMEPPILIGLTLLGLSGALLLVAAALTDGHPPLVIFLGLGWIGFFALGLLFGNLNALAMRPLGELAGLGSSIIASVSSLVAFVFAFTVEVAADSPVWAVAWAFALAAPPSAILILLAFPANSRLRLWRFLQIFR